MCLRPTKSTYFRPILGKINTAFIYIFSKKFFFNFIKIFKIFEKKCFFHHFRCVRAQIKEPKLQWPNSLDCPLNPMQVLFCIMLFLYACNNVQTMLSSKIGGMQKKMFTKLKSK